MKNHYSHLSSEERNMIQRGLNERLSKRAIAHLLNRAPSTVTREIDRFMACRASASARSDSPKWARYDAAGAAQASRMRRRRGPRKLAEGTPLRTAVIEQLNDGWSPEQVAGRLRSMNPDQPAEQVCHETIYAAIYATPKGDLRKSLISQLRRAHKQRLPRSRGQDRRGQLPDMVSIHDRPEEVTDRWVPGHWEGDLIKGAGNRSAVGTLVERTSRYVILVKMDGTDAQAALDGFTRAFKAVPFELRKTLTYDQGKEMARHVELAKRLEIRVFFADPHSPWQRPTNENTNGLIREYLPKGIDLSQFTQRQLDEIAWSLNNRPRKILGFLKPEEVFSQLINELTESVALQS
jgi:IS30 family transposase